VNAGIGSCAPHAASSSEIKSHCQLRPDLRALKVVETLSDTLPPKALDTNVTPPTGETAISTLTVLWHL